MTKQVLYLGTHCPLPQEGEVITHMPLIEIQPRPFVDFPIQECLQEFPRFTHIIITSRNTIPILQEYLDRIGYLSLWENKITIAVGKATERALRESGLHHTLVAKEERAEGIITVLQEIDTRDAYFFWPHSGQARLLISDYLQSHSIHYKSCSLYDPIPKSAAEIKLDFFDEIVFTSPSVVDAFFSCHDIIPSHLILRTIGPITAAYFRVCVEAIRG